MEKVRGVLMTDETVMHVAIQERPVANFSPDAVVLTNKRFMHIKMKLLGRFDFDDYVWRAVYDARITENMLGATINISTAGGGMISVGYLPKQQARAVYRYAQEMEESALADQRRRQLEDKQAASGATTIAFAGMPLNQPPAINPPPADPFEKLKQLKQMLDSELISQDEFDAKKARLLADM